MSAHKQNSFLNILLNVVVPVVVLMKFSGSDSLGPAWGLVVALLFPLGYGVYEYVVAKKLNFFSGVGIVSVLLTGGVGLLELGPRWLAAKEAGVPLTLGLLTLGSAYTRYPLVSVLLDQAIDHDKVTAALDEHGGHDDYEKRQRGATMIMAGAFFLSSILNYGLTRYLVTSPAGTEAFNQELARMTALQYPIIALPTLVLFSFAVYYLVQGVMKKTELSLAEILKT